MIPALILFTLHAHYDFLFQAEAWGWKSYADLSIRSPKWGLWDWIPHDWFHLIQVLKNLCGLLAVIATMQAPQFWIIPNFAMVFALYAVGRGIGFSAFVKWMAGR